MFPLSYRKTAFSQSECSFWVIETRVEVWENEKLQWEYERSSGRVFQPRCFEFSHVFYFFYKIIRRKLKRGNSLLCQSVNSLSLFMLGYAMAWTFPCFPYSYRNATFSRSKLTFSKCYFINRMPCLFKKSLSHPIPSYPIPSHPILSHPILSFIDL